MVITSTKWRIPLNQDALKYDTGKQLDHLLPPLLKTMAINAFAYGCKKYFENSWRRGFMLSRVYNAANHHLDAFFHEREDIDPESGTHHLDLAIFNVFQMRYAMTLEGKDDRPPVTKEQIDAVIEAGLLALKEKKND